MKKRVNRISDEEYAKGHYLPRQDLYHILETLYQLKLQSRDENGQAGLLIAKRPRHPDTFLLTDSESAMQDLRALIPLTDLLMRIKEMPKDMIDLDGFEYMMALKPQQIRPFVKKAILDGLTYTDKDGQEKPLAQFYRQKLQYWGKDIYGLCVPRTAQGQKALLKLAGFNVHTCDISDIIPTGLNHLRQIYDNGIKKGLSRQDLAKYYNVSPERIRQASVRLYRYLDYTLQQLCSVWDSRTGDAMRREPTDKDVLYITDSDGDFVMTKTAIERGLPRVSVDGHIPPRFAFKLKEKIIRFDYDRRGRED